MTQSYSCLSSVAATYGDCEILTSIKDPQHQIFLLYNGKGPPNSFLGHPPGVKKRSRPWEDGLWPQFADSLQLWLASYGYGDPTVLLPCCSFLWESHCFPKYLTYTEMLLWLDNFWVSSPGCINIVGMARQSMWICFAAAVSTFNVAQTSWLSWLYWHLRDALVAVLILRELSGLETIINGNSMHCASMKLPVWDWLYPT